MDFKKIYNKERFKILYDEMKSGRQLGVTTEYIVYGNGLQTVQLDVPFRLAQEIFKEHKDRFYDQLQSDFADVKVKEFRSYIDYLEAPLFIVYLLFRNKFKRCDLDSLLLDSSRDLLSVDRWKEIEQKCTIANLTSAMYENEDRLGMQILYDILMANYSRENYKHYWRLR